MKIGIDITKTIEQNAESYFEYAKRSRKKLEGAKQAVQRLKQELSFVNS